MPVLARALFALAIGVAAVSCSADPDDSWSDCAGGKCDESLAVERVHAPGLLVNDLAALGELEKLGFDLSTQLAGDGQSTKSLATSSQLFASVRSIITSDIEEIDASDSAAGVGVAFSHRLFDVAWLNSSAVHFRLVAITNRMDLGFLDPSLCGEVRFVYRLMYETDAGPSRLPMTLMVVRPQPARDGGCQSVAEDWQSHGGDVKKLVEGALARLSAPSSMELNLQAVRWPVGARPDMGGHAEYLMRVLAVNGQELSISKLPNTIATDLSESESQALREWIAANLAAIDRGTARVPDSFLASRAYSVSPRGLARLANRPFLQAFPNPEESFADLDLSTMEMIKTPGGLLRRLDTMTCQGCHQSRGLAGFHVLGEDDADAPRGNAIEVGTSPHLNEELLWRGQQLADLAQGVSSDEHRPFAERDNAIAGVYGAHCGLGDLSFAGWTCAEGFVCADLSGEEVGMCVPADGPSAGDSCETSSVTSQSDSHRDRVVDLVVQSCSVPGGARASCSGSQPPVGSSAGGFPTGSCTGSCSQMGAVGGDAICGATPARGFNACLGAGTSFSICLQNARPAFRRRCDAATPCGDDYVCSGVAGAPEGVGACMPPYFIFQARVDGHKVPG